MAQQTADIEVESWIDIVRQKISTLRFGSVQVIVHEGRVTQVESTEKTRLSAEPAFTRPAGSTSPSPSREGSHRLEAGVSLVPDRFKR